MTREHDPPHIRLYDWPNVPQRAKQFAEINDLDNILGVALIPEELDESMYLLPGRENNLVCDDDGIIYCFLH